MNSSYHCSGANCGEDALGVIRKDKAHPGVGGLCSIAKDRDREESLSERKKLSGHVDESAKLWPKLPFLSQFVQ